MNPLHEFARSRLFASTLEEKLAPPPNGLRALIAEPGPPQPALERVPELPPRPSALARYGRAAFPSLKRLETPRGRAQALHFFANHELQAVELMALALLRFPDAPPAFRREVATTLIDEQEHTRLYITRIEELGFAFGDLPLSDYLWRAMRSMRHPQDYVVHMSLTFEQANLDHSRHYQRAMQTIGDHLTAALLQRVYEDEIRHVKLGVRWFNRWRPAELSDWRAYKKMLRPPTTPGRARGPIFDADGRQRAGLSPLFIDEMRLCVAPRGRPPVLWVFEPFFERRVASGAHGATGKRTLLALGRDLEHLPMFVADTGDIVAVVQRPSLSWLGDVAAAGLGTAEFFETGERGQSTTTWDNLHEPLLRDLQPWGWDPDSHRLLAPLRQRVPAAANASPILSRPWDKPLRQRLAGKDFACDFLRQWVMDQDPPPTKFCPIDDCGVVCTSVAAVARSAERIFAAGGTAVVKARLSGAGHGVKRILHAIELQQALGRWLRNTLERQGCVLVEPFHTKVCDLSAQLQVGGAEDGLLQGIRRFTTYGHFAYAGTFLGGDLRGTSGEVRRFFFDDNEGVLRPWRALLQRLGRRLAAEGYRGPAGVDAMVYRHADGHLRLQPVLEVNTRWTLGRVALGLERHLSPGQPAFWATLPLKRWPSPDAPSWCAQLVADFPAVLDQRGRLAEGVVLTNDPAQVQQVMTILGVGDSWKTVRVLGLGG